MVRQGICRVQLHESGHVESDCTSQLDRVADPERCVETDQSKTEDVDVDVGVEDDVGGNAAGDLVNEDDHSTATAKQKTNYAAKAVVPHNPESSEDKRS